MTIQIDNLNGTPFIVSTEETLPHYVPHLVINRPIGHTTQRPLEEYYSGDKYGQENSFYSERGLIPDTILEQEKQHLLTCMM